MKRYPHKATIKISVEGAGLIPEITETEFEVDGRFEAKVDGGKGINYSGKFYCKKLDQLSVNQQSLDGAAFVFQGAKMHIVKAYNFQLHCEIWVD